MKLRVFILSLLMTAGLWAGDTDDLEELYYEDFKREIITGSVLSALVVPLLMISVNERELVMRETVLPLSPRIRSLGNAGTALSGDAGLLDNNPASLARSPTAIFMSFDYLNAFFTFSLQSVVKIKSFRTGLQLGIRSSDSDFYQDYELTDGSFLSFKLAFPLQKDWGRLSLGANPGFFIDKSSDLSGFCLDTGLVYVIRSRLSLISFGLAASDIGVSSDGRTLPTAVRGGFAYAPGVNIINLILDVERSFYSGRAVLLGVEGMPGRLLSPRIGMSLRQDLLEFTCGVGFVREHFRSDMAFAVNQYLLLDFSLSVGLLFK